MSYFTSIAYYFISGMNIWWIESWSKRKGFWSWFGAKIQRFGDKNTSSSSQKHATARAKLGTAVPPPRTAFCCFCLDFKLLYFSFTKKPAISCGAVLRF